MGANCCKEEEIDFSAEVELGHFNLLRSVGKGAFGKVRVVQHKGTKELFALKYINKAKCIKMRAVENIISERRLLESIDYPLIVNLRYAFQDDENLFMILDLMLGGDLRFHLERMGQMKEEIVKFYAAEVALGLAYLHKKKIVHRDLKPDNVLLDEKGHAHLTDFNIAVHYNERKPLTAVAGSMAYMAPEVLLKRGYFASVDWWSLGVVMFELLFGKRPFRGKTNDALTQAILHEPLVFPDNVGEIVTPECVDVLKAFINRDISKRLGCGASGLNDIKRHPWFANIDWDKLETKEATPPFEPDSKRANFDATHELEELLLEDNPLKVKKRKANNSTGTSHAGGSKSGSTPELSREMQVMEEKFVVYDYTKPTENKQRKEEIEQRRLKQKLASETSSSPDTRGLTGQQKYQYGGTVLDKIHNKPATAISPADILKMEELSRMARAGVHAEAGAEWRPPSGLMHAPVAPTMPTTLKQRDSLILSAGGVPPPALPPQSAVPSVAVTSDGRSDRSRHSNGTSHYRSRSALKGDVEEEDGQCTPDLDYLTTTPKGSGTVTPKNNFRLDDGDTDLEMVGIKKRCDPSMRHAFAYGRRESDDSDTPGGFEPPSPGLSDRPLINGRSEASTPNEDTGMSKKIEESARATSEWNRHVPKQKLSRVADESTVTHRSTPSQSSSRSRPTSPYHTRNNSQSGVSANTIVLQRPPSRGDQRSRSPSPSPPQKEVKLPNGPNSYSTNTSTTASSSANSSSTTATSITLNQRSQQLPISVGLPLPPPISAPPPPPTSLPPPPSHARRNGSRGRLD